MAYSSTLSTRMWNCSAVSFSAVLLDQFLGIPATAILQHDSNLPSDVVPPAPKQFCSTPDPLTNSAIAPLRKKPAVRHRRDAQWIADRLLFGGCGRRAVC